MIINRNSKGLKEELSLQKVHLVKISRLQKVSKGLMKQSEVSVGDSVVKFTLLDHIDFFGLHVYNCRVICVSQ